MPASTSPRGVEPAAAHIFGLGFILLTLGIPIHVFPRWRQSRHVGENGERELGDREATMSVAA